MTELWIYGRKQGYVTSLVFSHLFTLFSVFSSRAALCHLICSAFLVSYLFTLFFFCSFLMSCFFRLFSVLRVLFVHFVFSWFLFCYFLMPCFPHLFCVLRILFVHFVSFFCSFPVFYHLISIHTVLYIICSLSLFIPSSVFFLYVPLAFSSYNCSSLLTCSLCPLFFCAASLHLFSIPVQSCLFMWSRILFLFFLCLSYAMSDVLHCCCCCCTCSLSFLATVLLSCSSLWNIRFVHSLFFYFILFFLYCHICSWYNCSSVLGSYLCTLHLFLSCSLLFQLSFI